MQETRNKIIKEAADIGRNKILEKFKRIPRQFFAQLNTGNANTRDLDYYKEHVLTSSWYKKELNINGRVSIEDMKELRDYIDETNLSRRVIAERLGLSPNYFYKFFDHQEKRMRRSVYTLCFDRIKTHFPIKIKE